MESILDVLSKDLTTVDMNRPLLAKATIEFSVADCKITTAKDGQNQNVEIVLQTVNAEKAHRGDRNINPGYKLTHRVSLKPIDKNGNDRTDGILADLKRFRAAATGRTDGAFGQPAQYVGAKVVAKIGVESDATGQFGDQNRVLDWVVQRPAVVHSPAAQSAM